MACQDTRVYQQPRMWEGEQHPVVCRVSSPYNTQCVIPLRLHSMLCIRMRTDNGVQQYTTHAAYTAQHLCAVCAHVVHCVLPMPLCLHSTSYAPLIPSMPPYILTWAWPGRIARARARRVGLKRIICF